MNLDDLSGWAPIRVVHREAAPSVEWCDLSDQPFIEPFFAETVARALQHPFNKLIRHRTSLNELIQFHQRFPGPHPTGFIFHLSRCGSTLMSQMLAALPRTRVIAEAEPVEDILRLPLRYPAISEAQHVAALRAMVGALGGPTGRADHYIVKFDPWHTLDIPLIQRAFPSVPSVFIYRDPLEIIASHQRGVSGRMMGGPLELHLAGIDPSALVTMSIEAFWVAVLAQWCNAALRVAGPNVRFIEYRELPELVPTLARDAWGIPLRTADEAAMLHIATRDAKKPSTPFTPDSTAKRADISPEIRDLAHRQLAPLYAQLEQLRAHQGKESTEHN
jgi:hypothetical protein